jgi:hypothetical protein
MFKCCVLFYYTDLKGSSFTRKRNALCFFSEKRITQKIFLEFEVYQRERVTNVGPKYLEQRQSYHFRFGKSNLYLTFTDLILTFLFSAANAL